MWVHTVVFKNKAIVFDLSIALRENIKVVRWIRIVFCSRPVKHISTVGWVVYSVGGHTYFQRDITFLVIDQKESTVILPIEHSVLLWLSYPADRYLKLLILYNFDEVSSADSKRGAHIDARLEFSFLWTRFLWQ